MQTFKLWLWNPNKTDVWQGGEYEEECSSKSLHVLLDKVQQIEPKHENWVITGEYNYTICSGQIPQEWKARSLSAD